MEGEGGGCLQITNTLQCCHIKDGFLKMDFKIYYPNFLVVYSCDVIQSNQSIQKQKFSRDSICIPGAN